MCVYVCNVCVYVCLSAIGGMSTGPLHHRTRRAAQRAEHCLLGFGNQIVIPLISSLVSANTLKRQTHPVQHVPVSVCVCLSVGVQYKPPSPDDFVNVSKYNVGVFALIVALPWLWGQRQSNIVEQWSHERGGAACKHQHGLHFDVRGSLGHSCKAVRHV